MATRIDYNDFLPERVAGIISNEKLKSVSIVGSVFAISVVLFLIDPAGSRLYPSCPFHLLTGLHCPGCGTLRALHQILHLNISAALRLNPLMVFSVPFLGYAFLSRASSDFAGRSLPKAFVPAALIWALLVVIIAFWILRNIPIHPFSLLAPSG
jgi:hypothetical protein